MKVAVILLCIAMLLAAYSGSNRSERAHRALDTQYTQCLNRWGFGTDNFRTCLGHDR